jgi:hypothetical protein
MKCKTQGLSRSPDEPAAPSPYVDLTFTQHWRASLIASLSSSVVAPEFQAHNQQTSYSDDHWRQRQRELGQILDKGDHSIHRGDPPFCLPGGRLLPYSLSLEIQG